MQRMLSCILCTNMAGDIWAFRTCRYLHTVYAVDKVGVACPVQVVAIRDARRVDIFTTATAVTLLEGASSLPVGRAVCRA